MLTKEDIKSPPEIPVLPEKIDGHFYGKDILSVEQFSRRDLEILFARAQEMKALKEQQGSIDLLHGKVLVNLFYEASTRTDAAFSIAMKRLGGEVHNIVGVQFSSVSKGETLADTVRVLATYADVIVLRHHEMGSALKAATYIRKLKLRSHQPPVPLINGGDGVGEHPTQAFLDAYTIEQKFGTLEGLTVAMVGDLKHGRTVHSLAKLLSLFKNVRLIFVSPDSLRMPRELLLELQRKGVSVSEADSLSKVAFEADVFYITRVQQERFSDPDLYYQVQGSYKVDAAFLEKIKENAIIMHPLPRVGEITEEVDESPHAVYFEQAENGMYIRMALLTSVLLKCY
jgi:aspartate carbamoyltransferase